MFGEGVIRFEGHSAGYWHWQQELAEKRGRQLQRRLRLVMRPDADRALKLAAVTYGVPERQLRRVAGCESTGTAGVLNPNADNPRSSAGGLLQYLSSTWAGTAYGRAGFSRFDPYAAALAAARHVAGEISRHSSRPWRPWAASINCHGLR